MINCAALILSFAFPLVPLGNQEASGDPQALSVQTVCEEIHAAMLPVPGTAVDRCEGTFSVDDLGRDLTGCMIIVSGSWSELGGRSNPGDSVYKLLSDQGWMQEPEYSADGPDGTFFALSNGDIWCFIRGQWDGGDDADPAYVPSDVYQFMIYCAPFRANEPVEEDDE